MNFVRMFDIACGAVIAEFCVHCAIKRWRWKRRIKRQTGAQLTLIPRSKTLRVHESVARLRHRHTEEGGDEAS